MKNHLKISPTKYLFLLLSVLLFSTTLSAQQAGNYHAIFIAIDNYNSAMWKPLKNPVNDAKSVEKVLKSKYGFKTVTNLFNEDATRTNILDKLDKITNSLSEDDHLLIYYTGHGIEIGTDGYWVPYEAKSQERYELLSTGEIKNAVGTTKCKHVLILVDACFSSTIFKTATFGPTNDGTTAYYDRMEQLLSRQALTAGGLEPVPDGEGAHSIFAKYVLKFLDKNEKKNLSAGELFEMVKYPIGANSPNTPQFGHLQNTGHEGGQFIFRIQERQSCDHKVYFQEGQAIEFDNEGGTLNAKTNAANSRYVWTYNGEIIDNKTTSLKVKKSGNYGVTVITQKDCFSTASIEVNVSAPDVVIDILEGKKVNFTYKGKLNATIAGYTDDVQYEWKKGNFVVGNESSIEVMESGVYTVTIKLPNGKELGRKTADVIIKDRVYSIKLGDNVERIARNFYNDPNKASIIYAANPALKRGDVLRVGTKIVIPTIKKDDEFAVMNLGTAAAFAPFSQETLHNGGMITDIVSTVYASMGKKTAVNYVPNNQLKGVTFSGRVEASYPLVKNQNDLMLFKFSDPLYSTLTVFFASHDSEVIDMEETMKKRMKRKKYEVLIVGVPAGFSSDKLTQYYQNRYIVLKPLSSYEACFTALKNGGVDLVAVPQIAGLVTIKSSSNLDRADFKILDKSIESTTLHLVVSKEHPQADVLIEEFNKALAKAKNDGKISKIIDGHIDLIQKNQN